MKMIGLKMERRKYETKVSEGRFLIYGMNDMFGLKTIKTDHDLIKLGQVLFGNDNPFKKIIR